MEHFIDYTALLPYYIHIGLLVILAFPVKLYPPLATRVTAFQGFLGGYFSFAEFLRFLLPGRPAALTEKYWKILDDQAKKRIPLNPDDSTPLFGKPFYFPPLEVMQCGYHYVENLLQDVVQKDQYHLNDFKKINGAIIDAGSNLGMFSAFARHLFPNPIYAFEPHPLMFPYAQKNTKDLGVTLRQAGLGEALRNGTMYGHTFEDSGFGEYEKKDGNVASIVTLDSAVTEPVGFIKIDTEGYERNVLLGAKEIIKKYRPIIVMSAYHHPNDKRVLSETLCAIAPYRITASDRGEEDLVCIPEGARGE